MMQQSCDHEHSVREKLTCSAQVVNFAAGGVATPADAALCTWIARQRKMHQNHIKPKLDSHRSKEWMQVQGMQLGVDGVFVTFLVFLGIDRQSRSSSLPRVPRLAVAFSSLKTLPSVPVPLSRRTVWRAVLWYA